MKYTDKNGKIFISIIETLDGTFIDSCHKCAFKMVEGAMTQECLDIGNFCISQECGKAVYFIEEQLN